MKSKYEGGVSTRCKLPNKKRVSVDSADATNVRGAPVFVDSHKDHRQEAVCAAGPNESFVRLRDRNIVLACLVDDQLEWEDVVLGVLVPLLRVDVVVDVVANRKLFKVQFELFERHVENASIIWITFLDGFV